MIEALWAPAGDGTKELTDAAQTHRGSSRVFRVANVIIFRNLSMSDWKAETGARRSYAADRLPRVRTTAMRRSLK
jgi:hypothetical protein